MDSVMRSQWTTGFLIAATVGWLLYSKRLDLLFLVVPVSALLGYRTARARQRRQNRM
jgi:hypothetical protein